MPRFKFDKLVRDKIVDQQISTGAKPRYRVLRRDEHIKALLDKIIEESMEVRRAAGSEMAEEIADIQQALDDLAGVLGVTREDVLVAQRRKNEKAGAFKKGLYVDSVEVDETDKWAAYYRQHPDKYPEIAG